MSSTRTRQLRERRLSAFVERESMRDIAQEIACPVCPAQTGERCRRPDGVELIKMDHAERFKRSMDHPRYWVCVCERRSPEGQNRRIAIELAEAAGWDLTTPRCCPQCTEPKESADVRA